jgi:hypothetical protein
MKSLFAVLTIAVFGYNLLACNDSMNKESTIEVQDTTVSLDTTSEASDVEDDGVNKLDVNSGETSDRSSGSTDVPLEEQEEQLPFDPTEDPDQEASYYEFPAWHIP